MLYSLSLYSRERERERQQYVQTMKTRRILAQKLFSLLAAILCSSILFLQTETTNAFVPSTFQYAPNGVCVQPQYFIADDNKNFTMRNVPGEGDCMFLAVALATASSMGLGGNDALLRAISRETRNVVAQIMEGSGNLHIAKGQIVSAQSLLQTAAQQEGLEPNVYLGRLRTEGSHGGMYGGGPELAVLANVLRRPISIYELDDEQSDADTCARIVCKGVFGDGLFEDPCAAIPDSAILSAGLQPGAFSWQLHILIMDMSPTEKHACVLLPQTPI